MARDRGDIRRARRAATVAKTSALPNSYHIQPRPALLAALLNVSIGFQAWEYTHAPLAEQFETEGIRQVELDVFADPRGGLFARRGGLALIGEDPNSGIPELDQPSPSSRPTTCGMGARRSRRLCARSVGLGSVARAGAWLR